MPKLFKGLLLGIFTMFLAIYFGDNGNKKVEFILFTISILFIILGFIMTMEDFYVFTRLTY